jgi:hypothetical protein
VSEVPSTRLRAKSIILARNAYNAINIAFVNIVTYRQLSPDEWNWGPKSGFFWAGINAIFTTYIFFRMRKFLFLTVPFFSFSFAFSFETATPVRDNLFSRTRRALPDFY